MQVERRQFNLSAMMPMRRLDKVRGELALRGLTAERSALDVISRFPANRYATFFTLCDRIAGKKAGQVKLIFASPAEMFSLDFTKLNNGLITPVQGVVDFRVVVDSLGSSQFVGPPDTQLRPTSEDRENGPADQVAVQANPAAALIEFDQERELEFWAAYSRIMHVFQGWRAHYGMISEILKLLRVQNKQEIIIAGCGVGTDFLEFTRWFEENKISGVTMKGFDFTEAMVEKAKQNPLLQGIRDDITVQDWCQSLDYQDGSASHMASILVLGYLMNVDAALEQTLRVLAPGGGFAFAVTVPDYSPYGIFFKAVWHSLWDRGLRETWHNVPYGWRCISYMKQIKNKIKQGVYRGFYPDGIINLLEKKGFVNVTANFFSGDRNFVYAYGQRPSYPPSS